MPTASYQQPNDYNLVKDIRPFDMPYASYMQEIATKGQYFKMGADRVKSIYDQAAGLDPQYTQGREYLKGFMEQASKNLEKLNKSDLSIMDNAQQAARVFKPLFDIDNPMNAALLKDSQLNEHYKKQQKIADMYRTKDGGKEWNVNNELYYRDAQAKYQQDAQNGDYSTIDDNYQKRKSFIPYYDGSKELKDIQEACKGATTDYQEVSKNQMYFNSSKTSGCDPTRLAMAYRTQLSDRFKQQAYIDGYVHFKGQEQTLADKFTYNSIIRPKEEIDKLSATIAGLEIGGITQDEAAKIANLKEELKQRQDIYSDNLKEYNTMTKGNPLEYINNNYEKLAGQTYFNELTNNMAESLRTDSHTNKITPNPVGMLMFKTETDRSNMYLKNSFDINMENIKHKNKLEELDYENQLKNGNNSIPQNASPITTTTPGIKDITENYYMENVLKPTQDKATLKWNTLTEYIKTKFPEDYKNTIKDLKFESLDAFVKANLSKDNPDKKLKEIYDNYIESIEDLKRVNNKIEFGNNQIKSDPQSKNLFSSEDLSGNKLSDYLLQVRDNKTGVWKKLPAADLSEKDLFETLTTGNSVNGFTVKTVPASTIVTTEGIQLISGEHQGLFYNGEEVDISNNRKIGDLFRKVLDNKGDKISKINELKTKYYTNQYYNNGNFTINEYKPSQQKIDRIKSLLNVTGGENDKNGYKIVYRGATGEDAYFQRLDDKGEVITSEFDNPTNPILVNIRGENNQNNIVPTAKGQAYLIKDIYPRYKNLPGQQEYDELQKDKDDLRTLKDNMLNTQQFKNSNYISSKDVPYGVLNTKSGTGIPIVLSVTKQGDEIRYVGTYINKSTGQEEEIEAPTQEALLLQLKGF